MFVGQMSARHAGIGRQDELVIPAAGADMHDDVVFAGLVYLVNRPSVSC